MGICQDNSNQYLRDVGYNVIRLPRYFLPPLSLIGKQGGNTDELGPLNLLLDHPSAPLPAISSDQPAANINGKSTSSLSISLGVSILAGLIAGLGGGKLGATTSFTNARALTFEFNNVVFDSVQPLVVSNYLSGGEVDASSPLLQRYLLGDGALYVVTERLMSDQITVSFEVNSGVKASVDVPVIANQVGGSVSVALASGRTNAVTFKGPQKLTFGFKCFEIGIKNGVITMFSVTPGSTPLSLTEQQASGVLLTGSGLLDLGTTSGGG